MTYDDNGNLTWTDTPAYVPTILDAIKSELGDAGIYHNGDGGSNKWDVMGGKIFKYDPTAQIPDEVLKAYPMANGQEMQQMIDPDAPGNGNGGGGLTGKGGAFSDPEFWGGLASVALPGIGNYFGMSAEAMAAAKAATAAATGGNPLVAAAGSYAGSLLPSGGTDLGGGLTVDGYGNVTGGTGTNTGGSILPSDSGNLASIQNTGGAPVPDTSSTAQTYPITNSATGLTATELPAYEPPTTPPVTEAPPTVPRSSLQTVKDAASDVSKGLNSVKTSIYQPILQSLTDAGVPWEVVQKVPAVLDSATRGGLISGLTGGNALTGATIGALSSVLTTGLDIPAPLASVAASAAAGAIGMQGAGAAGGTNTISSLIDSILGTSSGTSSGASGSSSASPQPSTTTINNQPSTAMLTAAPWLQPSMINAASKSAAPQLFGGLSAEQAQVQDSSPVFARGQMYPTQSFEEYQPIQQTQPIPVAHGGLMHFEKGGEADIETAGDNQSILDLNKKIAQILSQKSEKSSTSEDQIKNYLAQTSASNSRLEFSPLLSSKLIRGRAARAEPSFSGLKNYDVPGATPSAGYSARQMQALRQLDPIMNMSRIPFAAHGGSIHPDLASVLERRNFKINKQMIPGPEGRYYAKHDQRGFAVGGAGTGQSDDIPTMLSDGEYVFDADTVAALGDGSTKAGSAVLDRMREEIRKHKRSAPVNDIPPKAKTAMAYLKTARGGK